MQNDEQETEKTTKGQDVTPMFNELIPITFNFEINYQTNEHISESIILNMNRTTTLQQATKEAVFNFNTLFKNKKYPFKFRTEGIDYKLQPLKENGELNEISSSKLPVIKLENTGTDKYQLIYNPQDIMINMHKKNSFCDYCLIA